MGEVSLTTIDNPNPRDVSGSRGLHPGLRVAGEKTASPLPSRPSSMPLRSNRASFAADQSVRLPASNRRQANSTSASLSLRPASFNTSSGMVKVDMIIYFSFSVRSQKAKLLLAPTSPSGARFNALSARFRNGRWCRVDGPFQEPGSPLSHQSRT